MKIPIIGLSSTKFGDIFEKGIRDLIKEAGEIALKDANINGGDVDTLYIANAFSLKTSNSMNLASMAFEELGIKNAICISSGDASGAIAIQEAAKSIRAGTKIVMVLGVEKLSDFKVSEIAELSNSQLGEDEQMAGSSVFTQFALVTNKYLHDFKMNSSSLLAIPIAAHKNSMSNTFAQFKSELTEQKINSSPYLAEPLRMMECASYCDGASALIMCAPEMNHKTNGYYLGGSSKSAGSLSKRKSIVEFESTKEAAHDAFKDAGIKLNDISIMELHDLAPISEVIALESLGFAKKGQGLNYIKEHSSKINLSGGLKACGHAAGATGIRQAVDIIKRLKANEKGLAHTLSGIASISSVNVFGGENA